MNSLTRYIFFQVIGPLGFFALALSGVVWLSQSLRLLDLVINRGQSAGTFLYLIFLMLPSLLSIVLPVSFFCACLYVVNRLQSDSELVVMSAAGMGRWAILKPLLLAAGLLTLVTLLINVWLGPLGMRTMKEKVFEIRTDIATSLVREGQFSNPMEGLTVYIKQLSRTGELTGLLVHDNRDHARPVTYMAAKGALAKTPDGPRLILYEGNSQWVNGPDGQIVILDFDKHSFDLSAFDKGQATKELEESERYIGELIYTEAKTDWEKRNQAAFAAEGHNRLATPLYNFVFVLVTAAFLLAGPFSRRGQIWRVAVAGVTGVVARLSGFAFQQIGADVPSLLFLIYLEPLAWMGGAAFFISRSLYEKAPREAPPLEPELSGAR
ncbi:MAG: LPS export ABC transporter permease LptF [Alphaproteobacteria bacterium]|nr:LPS export ABC transporter permease LptF [Alphaproteobacteria bacterium]